MREKTLGVGARKIIRSKKTIERTGMSWSTIRRLELKGLFPQRVRVGVRGVGHVDSEIDEYLASLERVPPVGRESV